MPNFNHPLTQGVLLLQPALSLITSLVLALMAAVSGAACAETAPLKTKFRDCPECPEMVEIPAGSFLMGSPLSEAGRADNEGPLHRVNVSAFAAGIYPVTRTQFADFVRESRRSYDNGCTVWTGKPFDQKNATRRDVTKNWREPGFQQTDRDPVVCISWNDAWAYVRWLNGKVRSAHPNMPGSGHAGAYRLLSEAEWEYAARGGTNTPYYWGTRINHENANYGIDKCPPCGPRTQEDDRWNYTSPVGAFPPNAFGLYDMSGNVFQWVEDCWHKNYVGAPSDGITWVTGECEYRVDRGGDWIDDPSILRMAYRDMGRPNDRDQFTGFRVAKTLDSP